MFSTFTTEHGVLIIRTADVRRIEDVRRWQADHEPTTVCQVEWEPKAGVLHDRIVTGTAQENMDRLVAEEMKLIVAAEERQQRQARGLPMIPISRGKKAGP